MNAKIFMIHYVVFTDKTIDYALEFINPNMESKILHFETFLGGNVKIRKLLEQKLS